MFTATEHGHAHIIAQLVSAGGDVNKSDDSGKSCQSPIFVAAGIGRADIIAQLLASRADPRSSPSCPSPLDVALEYGHSECAQLLKAALEALK